MDSLFRVDVLRKTVNPNILMYAALHQDYSEDYVFTEIDWDNLSESKTGKIVVNRLLKGEKGHFGVLEHPTITFNVGYFPHSVMQQARTHRVGVSFDCQSMRYSGHRICKAVESENIKESIERIFYFRPVGVYRDRQGKTYEYTESMRNSDIDYAIANAIRYKEKIEMGFSEEHARGLLCFDFRQHFLVSFNLRSILHFLDLRAKKNAQWEIQCMTHLMVPHIQKWVPQVWEYYETHRYQKARLAP